jgi:zinc transport system substrate-binding protein
MRLHFVLLSTLALAGCGGGTADDGPTVVAGLYPLAWAAEQVAGGAYRVIDATPPGAEPHDVELSPRDVEAILAADLVVYAGGGFQPAVDDAVGLRDGPSRDVLDGDPDPHVWLDPIRFSAVVREIGGALGRPEAAQRLVERLDALHGEYEAGLARCERHTLVVTHAAFGQLAARYGLEQLALAGTSPEAEPAPRDLERLVEEVRRSGATTIFSEPLVSDRLARTVAREAGLQVALLDPVEGLTEEHVEAGADYVAVMRENLGALREALGCR